MTRERRTKESYGETERYSYGVTATLVDTATGETRVEVARGGMTTRQATRVIAALCDELGPTWKVRTLSHPLSILRDLLNCGRQRPPLTESVLLGGIGRLDLVEWTPSYMGLRTDANRRRKDGR